MSTDPILHNELVALREDIRTDLPRDSIGMVRQVISPGQFEVEFRDHNNQSIGMVRLAPAEVVVLRRKTTLDEPGFWGLIDAARTGAGRDMARETELLVDALSQRSIADIVEFGELFNHFRDHAYRRELWAAASVICSGCSDDGFIDFRTWLVAQGEQIYGSALGDPETLLDLIEVKTDAYGTYGEFSLGGIYSAGAEAYKRKTGRAWGHFFHRQPWPELTGEEWDEETAYQKYPRLTARFNPGYPAQ